AYGKSAFYDDAINELYPAAYKAAIEEAKLNPVCQPEVEVTEANDEGFTFKAKVTTKPVIKVAKYKAIEAFREKAEVTSQDMDNEIADIREKYGRTETVEGRAARSGDLATIDFEGFDNGVAFNGGKGEDYPLALGSGTFIPGFEEQVEGHNAGEEFDINITFPEDYQEKSLAGHPVVFKIKLKEIKERQLPDLDDEFAKDASEFDTFAEFKKDLEAKLSEKKEKETKSAFEGRVMENIVAGIEGEIPECMYLSRMNDLVKDFAQRLSMQGLKLEDFLKYTGEDKEKFFASFRPQAENQVKSRLAMEFIAEEEKFEVSESEIDEEYNRLAEEYKSKVEELKEYIPAEDIKMDIGCRKALDFVTENAVALDEEVKAEGTDEVTAEEKPVKKTRAKKAVKAAEIVEE
ncbi:MAG: trigger factor, partial [Oscillospiraceae bacterium]